MTVSPEFWGTIVQSKIIALAALCALALVPPALGADEPVVCVQTYLSDAGYPVGKIDGKLGKTTSSLGNEFAAVYPELALPALTTASAPDWCSTLALPAAREILATRTLPPANAPAETIAKKGGLNFSSDLVLENFPGVDGLLHGFTKSLWPGRVTVDTDPARVHTGGGSIRMHLLPGDCGGSTHRGEGEWNDCDHGNARVDINSAATRAPEMFYGVSIMLGQNLFALEPFENRSARSDVNLYQWFQLDSGACFNLMFNTREKKFVIDARCGDGVLSDANRKIILPDARPDAWHEFVVHANWATDDTGFFRVLQNGKMVMAYEGPTIVEAGRAQIAEHPQIYAYGDGGGLSATAQYRTAATVWFDDMIRSPSIDALKDTYSFEDAALTDFDSALPIPGLSPEGDASLLAEGEADILPDGAILPGQLLPESVVSGLSKPRRALLSNSKGYGLTLVDDPAGGEQPALRFELRPGDCGQELGGRDDCAAGEEGVVVTTSDSFKEGEHYSIAWKTFIQGPQWPFSRDMAVLLQLSHNEFDYELVVTSAGLAFGPANEPRRPFTFAHDFYDGWKDFVIDVVWSKGKKGRISLTMNGKMVYKFEGATVPDGPVRPTFGIRRNGFKNSTSVVYFKDVVVTKLED
jgi:hypothetical protein